MKQIIKHLAWISSIIILLTVNNLGKAQSFNYGIRVGVGAFNQNWEFDEKLPYSESKDYKTDFIGFIYGEFLHNNHFSTKIELGYLKKGYINDLSYTDYYGIHHDRNKIQNDFNTFSFGISERIKFFRTKFKPYFKIGGNIHFIPNGEIEDHSLVSVDIDGTYFWYGGMYSYSQINDWNNITFNAIIGLGVSYNEILFAEFEYCPSLTPILNDNMVKVSDNYFAISVGININQFFKK